MGFKDTGALWRSGYDMAPDAFAAEEDPPLEAGRAVLPQPALLRARPAFEKYGAAVQPRTGPIRATSVGNMWAQEWGHIYDVVQPKGVTSSYSLDKLLTAKGYDATKMVKTGEGFYSSLGFAPLPQTFWERSLIVRRRTASGLPRLGLGPGRQERHPHQDVHQGRREDFQTVHHELGHNYYQRAYSDQPFLFKNGANDGFHEAIGDFVGLSAFTPTYLQQIGLLDTVPSADEDIPFLLKMALDKIAFLPFGLMVDKWRWQVFDGSVDPAHYNDAWWKLKLQYQGSCRPARGRPTPSIRREVPRGRRRALRPLLHGPRLRVPVPAGRMRPGRLEGAAAPLLGL
jgi:peptidyl-dipeptidase A